MHFHLAVGSLSERVERHWKMISLFCNNGPVVIQLTPHKPDRTWFKNFHALMSGS